MTTATDIRNQRRRIARSKEFRFAPARAALAMVHQPAFAACVHYEHAEFGWGPARVYRFRDGSSLTDDGRGDTVA